MIGRERFSTSAIAIRSDHAFSFPAGDFMLVSHEINDSIRAKKGARTPSVRAVAPPRETPITHFAFGTRRASRMERTSFARVSIVTRAEGGRLERQRRPRIL